MKAGDLTATSKRIKEVADKLTGRKYCSSCHAYQLPEGGKDVLITSGRHTRWKCVKCIKRISEAKYASKKEK